MPIRRLLPRYAFALLALASIILLAGCFESKHPLGPPQPGKVDLRYIGDWALEMRNDQGQTETSALIIRNIRNDQYYIEWNTGEDKPLRCTGYVTEIKGATFANLLPLTDDGKLAEKYMILRIDWDGPKLRIRNLDRDFFEDQDFDSSDELHKIVEQNLDNPDMYQPEPMIGTKTS